MKFWPLLGSSLVLVATLVSLPACTRPNPEFCCLTEEDCAQQGVSEVRTCQRDQVCTDHACRTVQCDTAAQCAGTEAPYCVNQLCASACTLDLDCAGAAGPLCAADGVCVGCESNADCPASAPVCDPATRACAPCHNDADCASGVCLAADGRCAEATELIYVSEGGVDFDDCSKEHPCRTFAHVLERVGPGRRVIRLLGATFKVPGGLTISANEVYVDGQPTELYRDTDGPVISLSGTAQVTLEGLKFTNRGVASESISVTTAGQLTRLSQIEANATRSYILVANPGTIRLTDCTIRGVSAGTGILAQGSSIVMETSTLTSSDFEAVSSAVTLRRNQLSNTSVYIGGPSIIENNLIVSTSPECLSNLSLNNASAAVQFNTWVCKRATPATSPGSIAVSCLAGASLSNNIFAWNSIDPVFGACEAAAHHNLFLPAATGSAGTNNLVAELSTLFVNVVEGDYHLKAGSPAKEAGALRSTVMTDLEGRVRPNPAGTPPDLGAYEAP